MLRAAMLMIGILLSCGNGIAQTPAAQEAARIAVDIEPQPLTAALNKWAEQTGMMVMVTAEGRAEKLIAPRVVGRYTAEEALAKLLGRTDFTYQFVSPKTVAVHPAREKDTGKSSASGVSTADFRLARTDAAQTPAADPQERTEPQNEPDAARGAERVEEVIVTARKREETLQDVPLSVSVMTGADLEKAKIQSADDLYGRIPGLYFTNPNSYGSTSDYNYLVLRGVGFNGGLEPSAGVFVDGMYQPQLGYDIEFLDLERLEVLRGPQGTLFGRNTQGGALNLVTRKPGPETVGRWEVEGARFGTFRGFGTVRGPLGENLFGALITQYSDSDGYISDPLRNKRGAPDERMNLRATLRWKPTDALDFVLAGDVSNRE